MTLEDRMFGRFPPLTAEQEADVQRWYSRMSALEEELWASILAEQNALIERLAQDFGINFPDMTELEKNARDVPSH